MLRFDLAPVCSNAYRIQAATTLLVSLLYLFTPYGWAAALLCVGGFIRGFISPHRCLSLRLFSVITQRLGRQKLVNAGSKMFADKLVCVMGAVMVLTWWLGMPLGRIPASALTFFAALDVTTGFCAACWAYAAWYKLRASGTA